MRLLLDTHLLLWALRGASPLPITRWREVVELLTDTETLPFFSAVSVWEVAIKAQRRRADFNIAPDTLRADLLASGYAELAITSAQAARVASLPPLHGDPFDRLLIAQAQTENLTLLTADRQIARYPGPIRRV